MIGKSLFVAFFRRLHILCFLRRMREKLRLARRMWRCRRNHDRVLCRIRQKPKNEKIRVLFLCSNTAKWKCQSVYERMKSSGQFEPIVAITALGEMASRQDAELREVFIASDAFFAGLGDQHIRVCSLSPRHYEDLRNYNPDIVFFPEPWELRSPQTTSEVSLFALPCYVPYFVTAHIIPEKQCRTPMHRHLFAYFTQNSTMAKVYEKAIPWAYRSYRAIPTGHPALDAFSSIDEKSVSGTKVIYAPHHSILVFDLRHPDWRIGTFLETGRAILDYAKRHLDLEWVFKPHPQLRHSLLKSGLWTSNDVDDYFSEWAKIGTVCTDGNYQHLFLESKAMITDSGSFLIEYGLTGKPLVHLVPRGAESCLSQHIKDLLDAYYRVETTNELESVLDLILVKGEDPKRLQRLAALKGTGLLGVNAAQNIVDYLRKELRR